MALVALAAPLPASASNWTVGLYSGGGESTATGAPSAPGSVSAACVSSISNEIKLTWSASAHASSYDVYQSTTSASSGFSVTASGVTSTSWTSAALGSANYWYEVSAFAGANWQSPLSSASGETTILAVTCTQP